MLQQINKILMARLELIRINQAIKMIKRQNSNQEYHQFLLMEVRINPIHFDSLQFNFIWYFHLNFNLFVVNSHFLHLRFIISSMFKYDVNL